jgi:transposase
VNSFKSLPLEGSGTEVSSKAKRRRFTAEYKKRILQEADGCAELGAIGALLRREGLYSSHLVSWRAARERGELAGLTPRKRGPKPAQPNPLAKKLAETERELARYKARLERAEAMIELQKKVSLLLGIALPEPPPDDESSGRRS